MPATISPTQASAGGADTSPDGVARAHGYGLERPGQENKSFAIVSAAAKTRGHSFATLNFRVE